MTKCEVRIKVWMENAATRTLTFDEWVTSGKMIWAVTFGFGARNSSTFGTDATADPLTGLHMVLHAHAAFLLVWVPFTASVAGA